MDPEQNLDGVNTNVLSKKQRRLRQKSLLKEQLHEFGNSTTLHGLRYITDRRLSIVEKIFWLILFTVSVGVCVYRINAVWTKWQESPVLVTVNEKLVTVGSVPFPSVTICPQMKTKASKFNFTDISTIPKDINGTIIYSRKMLKSETELFDDLLLVCKDPLSAFLHRRRHRTEKRQKSNVSTTVMNLLTVAPGIRDVMNSCSWRGKGVRCSKLFKTVITEEGICFNMNSISTEEMFRKENIHNEYEYIETKRNQSTRGWDLNGYYNPNVQAPYPLRSQGNGANRELDVIFKEKIIDHDKSCNIVNNGFKVYIQHPYEMPRASRHQFIVSPNQRSALAVKFNILSTAENIRHIPSEIRQCYFPNERPLRYFKIYKSSSCYAECLANITFNICKCVGFYMPRDAEQKVCGHRKMYCMDKAKEKLANQEANYEHLQQGEQTDACNCLPSCHSVDYEADIIKSDFHYEYYLRALGERSKYFKDTSKLTKTYTFSMLSMYYKKSRYVSMRRSELFGITEFLANCGGLLGLFLGFSFLSLVEIIYFITLRLWFTLKKYKGDEKSS